MSFLNKLAIRLALRNPPPKEDNRLPSSQDYPSLVNFVELRDRGGMPRFIVMAADRGGVSGRWFEDPRQPGEPRILLNRELRDFRVEVRQNYCKHNFTYRTALYFLVATATLYKQRSVLWYYLSQRRFNSRPLVRADRMAVLRHFLDSTLKQESYRASEVLVVAELHSLRAMGHPQLDEIQAYYGMLLESLVASGELAKHGTSYSLKSEALATLQNHEEQELRHRDMVNQQRMLWWLTAALVVVGLLQAISNTWISLR